MDPFTGTEVALVAATLLLGGFALETRVLPRLRVPLYHDIGFPLGVELPPIREAPVGEGSTNSVDWTADGTRGRYWVRPGDRHTPTALHGTMRFLPSPQGTRMRFTWSPPWSVALAALWLGVLGTLRGDEALMVPLAIGLFAAVSWLYWVRARRIAVELRMAFSRGSTPDADPDRE